jgi:type I restriction enzyme S subunit
MSESINISNQLASSLPKGWLIKKLGDVCHTTSGGTPSRQKSSYYNGNIPWVKSGELDKGLILDTEEKISEEAIKNSSAKVFPKGTLLIALYGATIGKLAFLGIDAATNQAVCGIYKNENIDSNFLFNFLFYKKPSLVKQGIGGAQPNISQGILKNLELPIPPLPEQVAIVAKIEELLSELENGKQQLLTAQQQLKVYRQSLLKWAFEGKLTNKNLKDGELPKGWKWVKFGSIFNGTPKNGLYKPSTEYGSGIPILRIDGFYDGVIVNDYEYKRVRISNEELSKYKLSIDDIVVNRVNSMSHLGKCGLLKSLKEPTVFESNVMKIQINKDLALPRYISNYLASLRGLKELTKNAKHAVNQASINQTDVSNVIIPLAPLQEQQLIVSELESKLTVCDKIEETISQSLLQAETLRQSILKKAFEGKLVTSNEFEHAL